MALLLKDLYTFTENRFQVFRHDVRVYIFGQDVTPWLKGQLSITYSDRDSFNSAHFELANPRKIWQITPANITGEGKWVGGLHEYSEYAKRKIYEQKTKIDNSVLNAQYSLDVKTAQFGSTMSKGIKPDKNSERRYRMAINDCIFNKYDWVRIFTKNPFNSNNEQWVETFCGFIQEHPITTNFNNGESTVRISCSCIKQQMQKMRVQLNIHTAQIDPSPLFDAGFYQDFIRPSLNTHPFATTNLQQSIMSLILGDVIVNEAEEDPNIIQPAGHRRGVGFFKAGNFMCYDPAKPGNTLERWHLMTMFGVNKVPWPNGGGNDDLWLTSKEMKKIGEETYPHQNSKVGSPIARYLHFLLPIGGSGASRLIASSVSNDYSSAREWSSRWEIIRDFASKLDFQVLTSPSGDILVEFPQYGFTPCIYGGSKSANADCSNSRSNDTLKPLANLFTFDYHQKEETLNDEAEDFPTVLMVGGGMAQQETDVPNSGVFSPRAYVFSPLLVDRYGVISESTDIPYAGQHAGEYSADEKSALTRRLSQLGMLEFTKRMANASTWSGSVVYRPFLFPNRPVELVRSARVGLLTSVTNTWQIGQSAETTFNLNMLMAKKEDGVYRLLTGATHTPLDYNQIWGDDPDSDEIGYQYSGVRVGTGTVQQGKTEAKQPPASGDKKTTPGVSAGVDLTDLYPPFGKLVQEFVAACQSAGIPITIKSGYRSTAEQALLETSPTAITPAHAGRSLHQFGLAIDAVPSAGSDSKSKEDQTYVKMSEIAAGLSIPLEWGGNFSHADVVHFQAPTHLWGIGNRDRLVAVRNAFLKEGELEAVKKVWQAIDSANPSLASANGPTQAPDPAVQAALATAGGFQSSESIIQGRGEGGITAIPLAFGKACAKDARVLSTPGLIKDG